MKIAICDDEINDLNIIKDYITRYNSSYSIACFDTSLKLLDALNTQLFDIIFLDIEMTAPNGYEAAKIIKKEYKNTFIVFTTNSLDYAIRGYEVAFRYLPKPITYQMFHKTFSQLERKLTSQKLEITTRSGATVVNLNDIMYFESFGHSILFHMSDNSVLESRNSIKNIFEILTSTYIVQIHKSYGVNLNYITSTTTNNVILSNNISLPIGRKNRDDFRKQLQNFIRES